MVDGGASAHIGITAPARANSGICSIRVAAVRNRWPPTRSPVCQSYHSPAGR